MADYLLDTNHASPLVTLSHPLRQQVLQRAQEGHRFAICVPVLTEVLFGIGLLPRAKLNIVEWARLKPHLPCYIPTVDALIATIALRYRLTLLTTDKDFRAVPKLEYENWLSQ